MLLGPISSLKVLESMAYKGPIAQRGALWLVILARY